MSNCCLFSGTHTTHVNTVCGKIRNSEMLGFVHNVPARP